MPDVSGLSNFTIVEVSHWTLQNFNAHLRLYEMTVKPGEMAPIQSIQSAPNPPFLLLRHVDEPGSKPDGDITGLWFPLVTGPRII
jgi:hypothetical protein